MIVAIAGGHGQVARLLARELVRRGHEPIGLVRNPAHLADLASEGARGDVIDLEHSSVADLAAAIAGTDAVVFAAGAGPGSGAARKETVDRAGAALLADAAERAGIRRYVMVSGMGAERVDPQADPVYQAYQRAKAAADADLRTRTHLDWTIVRPARLTDGPGTGMVEVGPDLPRGEVPRADVASVLAELVVTGAAVGVQFDLVRGRMPMAEAVAAMAG